MTLQGAEGIKEMQNSWHFPMKLSMVAWKTHKPTFYTFPLWIISAVECLNRGNKEEEKNSAEIVE